MESSISTTETFGRGTSTSNSCSPNDKVRPDRAGDARASRLSWPPTARRPRGGAAAAPGGRARSPHQRPPEARARAGGWDRHALRLTPPDCRLGVLRGGSHGHGAAERESARYAPPERLSVRPTDLPFGGDGCGLVGPGGVTTRAGTPP